jgi:hypothetical protein
MRNYNDPQYKQWRKNIKKRDKNICQWPTCNSKNKIHVHHIMKWSDYPGLRYHPYNGISLCKTHHDLIKNNEENYMSFFLQLILNKYGKDK